MLGDLSLLRFMCNVRYAYLYNDLIVIYRVITKTRLFKYTENFTIKKMKKKIRKKF